MIAATGMGSQAVVDVAQAGLAAGLGVEQRRQVIPGVEALGVVVGFEVLGDGIKTMSGDELEQLVQNRVRMSHGGPPSRELSLSNPILLRRRAPS